MLCTTQNHLLDLHQHWAIKIWAQEILVFLAISVTSIKIKEALYSSSGGFRGFQGFHGNPLLKFIYSNRAVRSRLSNRAVRLRCFNYSSFIRNYPVINVKYCWERSMKVDDLFFWSSTQTELAFLSSWNPLSKILDPPLSSPNHS